jgi:hypothetical protein
MRRPNSVSTNPRSAAPSAGLGLVHVALHARKAGEVAVDVVLGRLLLDAQRRGQPEGTHAVDEAEVDRLGITALFG